MGSVCVFWTAYQDEETMDWRTEEFKNGRLRQGWGGPGTQLRQGRWDVNYDNWLNGYQAWARTWDPKSVSDGLAKAEARFKILQRMLDLKRGDLLIVPHVPGEGKISLSLVDQGYFWDDSHFDRAKRSNGKPINDFGHYVSVDPNQTTELPINSCRETQYLASKFQNYRSAVNFVRQPEYSAAAWQVFKRDELHPI
jgi:hypothetical protein